MEKSLDQEEFLQWYVDMIENYPSTFVHYLSDNAMFQWFGRSIKGPDRILNFIKTDMQGAKHILEIQNPGNSSVLSDGVPIRRTKSKNQSNSTPDSNTSTVDIDEFACGDGPNIDNLPLRCRSNEDADYRTLCFFETAGTIEFSRPCSKRSIAEMKCERSCNLRVGYIGTLANPLNFTIKTIVYGNNMPCKRNLLPEFDACVDD